MRGRRTLCQENGEDNEILSEQLKEIRRAASHDQLERIIKRIRRRGGCARSCFVSATPTTAVVVFDKAAITLERHQPENDRNSKYLSQFLRPVQGAAAERGEDSATFGYFPYLGASADEQLMSVIRSPSGARLSGKWWPNGMSCEEFRDIRTVLFSNQSFRETYLRTVKLTSGRRKAGGSCDGSSECGQPEKEHPIRGHQLRSRRRGKKTRTVGGDGDGDKKDSGGKLNKGFHWRINFLLERPDPEAQPEKKELVQSVDNGGGGGGGNCVVNWTIKSDKMGDIVAQFDQLQVSACSSWPDQQQQCSVVKWQAE